jgi:hypothetical protein
MMSMDWEQLFEAGRACLSRGDPDEAELHLQRAQRLQPTWPEPSYELSVHFRLRGASLKAMHYCAEAEKALAADTRDGRVNMRRQLFYERSILTYYVVSVTSLGRGAAACMQYADAGGTDDKVFENMRYYTPVLSTLPGGRLDPVIVSPNPTGKRPSSISIVALPDGRILANVRCVNYTIDDADRFIQDQHQLRTDNLLALVDPLTLQVQPGPWAWTHPFPELTDFSGKSFALGLEDVRLFLDAAGNVCFGASHQQYAHHGRIRVLRAKLERPEYTRAVDPVLMEPPGVVSSCEKNWIPLRGGELWIYGWHPLRICRELPTQDARTTRLVTEVEYETPAYWKHFRGSTIPIEVNSNELWIVVHFKYGDSKLHYAHAIVVLDAGSLRVLRSSTPFYMAAGSTIEYCIGFKAPRVIGDPNEPLAFFFSTRDGNPRRVTIPARELTWVDAPALGPSPSGESCFVTSVYGINESRHRGAPSCLVERFGELVRGLGSRARLHVFTDPESEPAVRAVVPVGAVVHVIALEDLEVAGLIRGLQPPVRRTESKDTADFLLLMNAKAEFMARALRSDLLHEQPRRAYAWIDAGISKLSGIARELPFLADALRRVPSRLDGTILLPGIWGPMDRGVEDSETSRSATGGIHWRFAGGFLVASADSVLPFWEVQRETLAWLGESTGRTTWEVNVWAAAEARGRFDDAPCLVRWLRCDHNLSLLRCVQEHW